MAKSADAFRTISEVAEWLGVQTHVLRFWESKFTQVKPVKRAGGRRYYRPVDMLLLGGIKKLLHEDGLTIKGVQKILREKGMAHVSALSPGIDGLDIEVPKPMSKPKVEQIKPAPMQEAELETAEVVPLIKEPVPVDPIERPSFTQDAVVMPEAPSPETDVEPEETRSALPDDEQIEAPAETITATDVQEAAPETQFLDTETQPDDDVEPEIEIVTEISESVDAPAETEVVAETVEAKVTESEDDPRAQITFEHNRSLTEPETAKSDPIPVLPSFLSRAASVVPPTDNMPASQPQETPPAAEEPAEAAKPTPNIIEVPETATEADITVSPRVLSALAKTKSLTPAQATAIAPLLAQLRDVRDRTALARKE